MSWQPVPGLLWWVRVIRKQLSNRPTSEVWCGCYAGLQPVPALLDVEEGFRSSGAEELEGAGMWQQHKNVCRLISSNEAASGHQHPQHVHNAQDPSSGWPRSTDPSLPTSNLGWASEAKQSRALQPLTSSRSLIITPSSALALSLHSPANPIITGLEIKGTSVGLMPTSPATHRFQSPLPSLPSDTLQRRLHSSAHPSSSSSWAGDHGPWHGSFAMLKFQSPSSLHKNRNSAA
eukprot:scaffold284952_cov21-Tisochrysis_lutea.AAC.1